MKPDEKHPPRVWVPISEKPARIAHRIDRWPAFAAPFYKEKSLGVEYLSTDEHAAIVSELVRAARAEVEELKAIIFEAGLTWLIKEKK